MKYILAVLIFILNASIQAATISIKCPNQEAWTEAKIQKVRFQPLTHLPDREGDITFYLKNNGLSPLHILVRDAGEGIQLAKLLSEDESDKVHINVDNYSIMKDYVECTANSYTLEFNGN
jgi:hypothetical protein